jgi:Beta propeller domain
LTVLRPDPASGDLKTLSTLPNDRRPASLGKPGEQLYGVRFDADRAYLVTFRVIDPLYVLDLSNAADPKTAGELEIPGMSDTLVALGDGLLLGVGRDASTNGFLRGVKLSLFDVSNASQPRELRSWVLGDRGSQTALDFSTHGLNLHRVNNVWRLALPMVLRNDFSASHQEYGLFRFEVDSQAKTLTQTTTLSAPPTSNSWDLSRDRSLQLGGAVYYLSQGHLQGAPWVSTPVQR